MDLSAKIRYTDTSYIIAQQWAKGGEKHTFPNVYAHNYNRQKFANLEKCDEKQANSFALPLSPRAIKRPLPVPPPVPPPPPPPIKRDDPNADDSKHDTEDQAVAPSNVERKQKRRRTRSLERLRDQSNDIELSDSDEDIAIALKIPIIKTSNVDEPDHASATSPSISDAFNVLSNTTVDEPAICGDSPGLTIDTNNTFSDKSQLSYDEILKIEESFDDDGANGFMNRSIVVDIHSEPTIELRIHESDSDPAIQAAKSVSGILNASKLTKEQMNADFERERCYSEDDAIDLDGDDDKERPERLVQSDSELLSKTPLELVVECDINENVIVSETKPREIIDLDHNHNDIVKSVEIFETEPNETNENHLQTNGETKLVQNRESQSIVRLNERPRCESVSSRSSFSESDGNEPVYATVDTTLNTKNYDAKSQISKSQTFPLKLSQYQDKTAADHLGLNYVTERILASVLPNRAQTQQPKRDNESTEIGDTPTHDESPQDIYEQELISMLEQKHGKNYKLFDLESCISTITLEKLCELCKHMDSWLGSGREKVVILQDRGDRQRLGSAIAAYLEYLNICASTYAHRNGLSNEDARAQSAIARNWLDLDIFSMKKFLEDVIGPLRVPSHRRYLKYFSGLLSGKIKINSLPLYLRFITIESPPSWLQHEPIALQQAEWRSFIKIYEGLNCVFTSDIHVIPITTRQFIYEIGQLRLRGDVIIRCYQITTTTNERTLNLHSAKTINRELIFSTQFHTCAITERDITFYRNELDYACDDPRIPVDHKVTLHFGDNNQLNENRGLHFQSPLVKLEPLNAVAKYNSLERFDDDSLHTQGPLDGSLYATILKSPKSPLKSPTFPPAFISNIVNNNHQRSSTNLSVISSTPKTSSTQNLISPPPEFSNKKIVEIKECYTTLSPIGASPKIDSNLSAQNKSLSRSYTSTPSYEEIQVPSRSSSREATLRYQTAPRSSSSLSTVYQQQPDLPQRSSSASRAGNYTSNQSNQYIRTTVVDNYNYVNAVQNGNRNQSYQDGRESVKSPLTLSMDSGISSSGIANRRIQGSSVSPSSYPSQSPQDRHQELDDILSDMLLTVQGIPDIGKTQQNREVIRKTTTTTQNSTVQNQQRPQLHLQIPKQQQPPLPLSQQQQQHLHLQPLYGSTNTVKRSQSYTSQDESNCSTISRSTVHTTGHIRDRVCGDFYDTASTTTTITPTPSESGRITPFQQQHQYTRNDNKLTQQAIEQRERELIMDLQNQSFDYSHPLRTGSSAATVNDFKSIKVNNSGVTSEDDESIPYHAREDSRPFTYGDATGVQLSPTSIRKATGTATGTGMIKLQSGLSSPSLVRKHLGSNATNPPTTARKSPNNGRNDFEEMLLQRREKILNDKYSIGDKTPNGNSVSETNNLNASATNKWNTSSNTLNGYQYHEPLKRSNTMDGGFGRGNTSGYVSDGSSGQTWLQLQQQKLRAKKELQHKGDNEYCERNVHIDNRNRPLRSRSSQSSHRYDGYSSDTGAFDSRAFIDEVDYRQPLHVQTPNRPNERYHTITKTTTATNERPFVSVKRAHEQSKANNNIIGSPSPSPLSILNASPHGHIAQAQSPNHNQNGLLSLADNNELSPVRNGHARLESDSSNSSPLSSSNTSGSPAVTASPTDSRTCDNIDGMHQSNGETQITNGLRSYCTKSPIIIEENGNDKIDDSSYLALDQLLASLALENDIMERHLSQINNNDTNDLKFKHQNQANGVFSFDTNTHDHYVSNGNYQITRKQNGFDENLNDVLANLIEFSENESLPQHQNTNGHTNSYANGHHLVNGSINNNHHHHNHHHLPSHFNHLNNNNFNNNNHINNNYVTTNGNGINNNHINRVHNYHEPSNNAIKRLTSESENSSSVSPSLSERSNGIVSWSDQVREESFSSYRSETEPETSLAGSPRPETPAFPLTPRTPYGLNGNISPALPPKSPTSIRRLNMIHNNGSTWSLRSGRSTATYDWSKEIYSGGQTHHINQNDVSCYTSRRNSTTSTANSEPQEIAPHLVKFVRDSSKFWYKPTISREEAIALLRNAHPGSFLVRDSTTFAKAFGLVLKVSHPPPGVQSKGTGDELVRHFLVEPTTRGVRLKGCSNEPVFTSLSALVYQHSITPLALPCKLIIPDRDLQNVEYHSPAQQQLMTQGAACNVLFLFTYDTESLTGPEAIRKAVSLLYSRKPLPKPTEVHFKVTQQGITLTDNTRQLFFRKHYPANNISFCGLDPDDRRWSIRVTGEVPVSNKTIFAFVARRSTSSNDNQCHVFCELEPNQPAAAITAFANKVIPSYGAQPYLQNI
ncbi:uncharacterized protein LOC116349303 isoform X3 [Contarinia nasturtii]|uniref:uncharacterized protein LOC116349303 isoform X3 n=1 Tax=Contarinia nasturtii TaxID=265458 RepID=UPI0012D3D5A7|nr:uncharacterized protein LOC116349303 isoform X3 [Contarinia nasturtii]